ncbi:MAG: Asp-tRNA(Asn)/Glu-tRNA(Gln) amidotransferase subunit GatC [Gammaproteobacteria bacterium]|jgi:aspartyl-tRNA(Asn)/glutamyl-tRNA(Gln) amidotransferase subunit C|nr:Asp-tRNA(Asn)/Glu-tRNA(Gln) amidotransferase subunit GatC [Gammaproteobacteria bacterium]
MSLDNKEVSQIAYLSRLQVEESSLESITADLNNILNLVEQLSELDTDSVEPMAHPIKMTQRLREDVVTETDQSESFQSIAPKTGKSHYLVPTVIE